MMSPTNPNEDDNPFSPKRKWKKHKQDSKSGKEDSSDNSCPICLGSLLDQEIATPECCDHSFCLICIKEWASKVKTCPVDRLPFTLLLVRQGNQASISTVLTVRAPGVFEPLGGNRGEQQVVECSGCHLRVPKCVPFPMRLIGGRWYCTDCHFNLMDLDSAPDSLPSSLVPPVEATAGDFYDVIYPEPSAVKSSLLVPTSSLQLVATGSVEISSFENSRSPDVLGSILQSQLQLHRSNLGWGWSNTRQCPQSPGSSSSGSPPRPSSPQSTSRPSSPSLAMLGLPPCREPCSDPTASFLLDASLSLSIKTTPNKKVPVSDDDVDIYSDIESLHENDLDREPTSFTPLQPLAGGDSGEDSSENELVIDLQSTSITNEDCAISSPASYSPGQPEAETKDTPNCQDLSDNSMDESTLYRPPPDSAKIPSLQDRPAPPTNELYDPFNIEDSSASGNIISTAETGEEDASSSLMEELISKVEHQINEVPLKPEEEMFEEEAEPPCNKMKLDPEESERPHSEPPTPELKDPEPDFILEKDLTLEAAPGTSCIKLPETEDISDTEDEPFPPDCAPEDDDREEGEIIEVEEVKKPPTKKRKPCKKHHKEHKSCHKDRSPSLKSNGESGETREDIIFKTKGYEKFSLILGDQYEQNVGWKRLSKSNKDRSYRDGKPKDEEVLFKVRELKRKRKSNAVADGASRKKKESCEHHKNKKIEKAWKKERSRTRDRSRERSRSYVRRRSHSKSRSHSRSRFGWGSSHNRNRSNRSHNDSRNHLSKNQSRSRNNSRIRSRSPLRSRARSRSRNRNYGRSRSRKRSAGRSRSRNRSYGRSRSRNRRSRSFARSPPRNSSRYRGSNKRSRYSRSPEKSRSRNHSFERSRHSRSLSRTKNEDRKLNSRPRRDKYSTSRSSTQERSHSGEKSKAKSQPVKTKEKGKTKLSKKLISNPNIKSQVVSEEVSKPKSVKIVGKKKKTAAIIEAEDNKNGDSTATVQKATKKKHDKHHGEKKGKVKKKKKHVCPHEHARKKDRNISTVDSGLKIELEKHEPCSKSELYADTLISKLEQQNNKPSSENIIGNSLESKEIYTKGDSIIINLNFNSNKEDGLENKSAQDMGSPLLKEVKPQNLSGPRDELQEKESPAAATLPPPVEDMYWPSPAESFKNGEEEKEVVSPGAKELTRVDTESPAVKKVSPASSPGSTGGDSYDPCQPTMSPSPEAEQTEACPPPSSLTSTDALSLLPSALVYLAQLKPGLLPTPPKFIGGPPLQAVLPAFPSTITPCPPLEKRKASVAPLKRTKLEDFDKLVRHEGLHAETKALPDISDPSSSEKFLLKLNRQERVIEEVKMVLKPFYNKRDIDKDDYKEILRKSVPKICHNKTREINPIKIKHLVEGYVQKYKYLRKKLRKQPIEF